MHRFDAFIVSACTIPFSGYRHAVNLPPNTLPVSMQNVLLMDSTSGLGGWSGSQPSVVTSDNRDIRTQ